MEEPFDSRDDDQDFDRERDRCDTCGGQGFIEYFDHPEVWGEDCPSLQNHLLTCPTCRGSGVRKL